MTRREHLTVADMHWGSDHIEELPNSFISSRTCSLPLVLPALLPPLVSVPQQAPLGTQSPL